MSLTKRLQQWYVPHHRKLPRSRYDTALWIGAQLQRPAKLLA